MLRMANSDDYRATLLALGPGLISCAVMGVVEFGGEGFALLNLIFAYALALLIFLPGLPMLGYCLARASPRRLEPVIGRVRMMWLVLSLAALTWHIVVLDISFRLWRIQSPVTWPLVIRYDACVWLTTAGLWVGQRRLRGASLNSDHEATPA